MPLSEFSALIKKKRRAVYDPSTLSRMENGTRKVTLEDINDLAPLDPLRRGRAWLACWDDEALVPSAILTTEAASLHSYTEEERQADAIQAEKDRAALAAEAVPRRKRKAGGRK